MKRIALITAAMLSLLAGGCRQDEVIFTSNAAQVAIPRPDAEIAGFYLLNEGNMGMNRASIDLFDARTGMYATDIYSERNPDAVKELGDVGTDIKIYGNKVYAVINCSNKIEVMDKWTARRIAVIDLPNCRYLAFHGGKVYVSSYSGPVSVDPNAEIGFVAEIDTVSLSLTRKVAVGYQPEEMVIHDGKLYVANSGGYRVPNYDRTVSVVDLESFTEIGKIDVAINLHRMRIDPRGYIYVTSRGDYYHTPSDTFVIDTRTDQVVRQLGIPASGLCMHGDSLFFYSVEWSHLTAERKITYGIYDTYKGELVSDRLITDGTDARIMIPYGLAVNPETGEIYVADAQNYVVTGYLYCFTPEGKLKWKVLAGNIPGHIAFL